MAVPHRSLWRCVGYTPGSGGGLGGGRWLCELSCARWCAEPGGVAAGLGGCRWARYVTAGGLAWRPLARCDVSHVISVTYHGANGDLQRHQKNAK